MSDNITAFVDNVGRTIVARENSDKTTDTKFAVTNPSVVNINVNQEDGQISVQLLPYVFREFISQDARYEKHTWYFNTSQVTVCEDFKIDEAVANQYVSIFETTPAKAEASSEEDSPEVVELFDDEAEEKTADTT